MLHTNQLDQQIENLRTLQQSYDQIAGAAEAYNTGKVELAQNITAKGVQAAATETLPELAEKVAAIPQTETIIDGGKMYSAQLFGDGALWDLYRVLAEMKTRWLGTGDYAALIVCEYYKGYDSLQLQGADGYYTCDGNYYDYASPNHIWHDSDNGKMNRWVCFLYHDEGARLDITNTAISPRSMYIGGHIGTIEYFVNGRLTELVCGVEETDVVGLCLIKQYTQEFIPNITLKNIDIGNKTIGGIDFYNSINCKTMFLNTGTTVLGRAVLTAQFISIPTLKTISRDGNYGMITAVNAIEINLDNLEKFSDTILDQYYGFRLGTYCQKISMPKLTEVKSDFIHTIGATGLFDIIVGEVFTNLPLKEWNPTNILADATKKAQLIENIKNHILARVSDATGSTQLVFTISTNMYNEVASETIEWQGETITLADAFLTKNWLMAGA